MSDLIQIQTSEPVAEPAAEPGAAGAIAVPSGQLITLLDVIWNVPGPLGMVTRFRFLAPQISQGSGTVDFETAYGDMLDLCQSYALPAVEANNLAPSQIIISLSDRDVPFGQADPEATQFFEAYRIENRICIWEVF
jgi:hypothetical protein